MRPISNYRFGVTLLIATALFLTAACDQNKLKEAAKAADRIEIVSTSAIDTIIAFQAQNVITRDQEKAIASILLDVNTADAELIRSVRAATTWDEPTRQAVVRILGDITAAVARLNDAGLLHIHNADAQAKFTAIVAALQSALAIIRGAL